LFDRFAITSAVPALMQHIDELIEHGVMSAFDPKPPIREADIG
jgi:hypothetical protein